MLHPKISILKPLDAIETKLLTRKLSDCVPETTEEFKPGPLNQIESSSTEFESEDYHSDPETPQFLSTKYVGTTFFL